MADVFISHARADRKRAESIAEGLEAEGLSVVREETPARTVGLAPRTPVAESGCALVIWSRASARVDELAIDAAQAFNQGKFAPVILQNEAEPPHPFDLVEGIDLTQWRGKREDPAWYDLVRTVKATVAHEGTGRIVRQAPPPPPPPPKPVPVQTANMFKTPEKRQPLPVEERRFEVPPDEEPAGRNRFVLFAAGALALFVLSLWGGPRAIDLVNRVSEPEKHVLAPAEDLLDHSDSDVPGTPIAPASEKPAELPESPPPPLTVVAPPSAPKIGGPVKTASDDTPRDTGVVHGLVPATAKTPTVAMTPPSKPAEEPKPTAKPAAPKPTTAAAAPKPTTTAAAKPTIIASAKPTPATPAKPAPTETSSKPDPAATMASLEKCLSAIAKQCTSVDPAYSGTFSADAKLSAGERKLLTSSLFPDRSVVTTDNVTACQAAVKAKATSKPCQVLAPKTPTADTATKPATSAAKPATPAPTTPKPEPAPKPAAKADVPL